MSSCELPKFVDPYKFADQDVSLSGSIRLSSMSELGAVLAGEVEDAAVSLNFHKDDQGYQRHQPFQGQENSNQT